jgi:hypothetical protein
VRLPFRHRGIKERAPGGIRTLKPVSRHPVYSRIVCMLLPLGTVARAPSGIRTRTSAMGRQQAAVTSWVLEKRRQVVKDQANEKSQESRDTWPAKRLQRRPGVKTAADRRTAPWPDDWPAPLRTSSYSNESSNRSSSFTCTVLVTDQPTPLASGPSPHMWKTERTPRGSGLRQVFLGSMRYGGRQDRFCLDGKPVQFQVRGRRTTITVRRSRPHAPWRYTEDRTINSRGKVIP